MLGHIDSVYYNNGFVLSGQSQQVVLRITEHMQLSLILVTDENRSKTCSQELQLQKSLLADEDMESGGTLSASGAFS